MVHPADALCAMNSTKSASNSFTFSLDFTCFYLILPAHLIHYYHHHVYLHHSIPLLLLQLYFFISLLYTWAKKPLG